VRKVAAAAGASVCDHGYAERGFHGGDSGVGGTAFVVPLLWGPPVHAHQARSALLEALAKRHRAVHVYGPVTLTKAANLHRDGYVGQLRVFDSGLHDGAAQLWLLHQHTSKVVAHGRLLGAPKVQVDAVEPPAKAKKLSCRCESSGAVRRKLDNQGAVLWALPSVVEKVKRSLRPELFRCRHQISCDNHGSVAELNSMGPNKHPKGKFRL
jgi:hypothetical protein